MKDSYFERQKVKDMLDKKKVKLGIAPIGWTNDDMPDLGKENTFQQCVSEMALAGFTGSEVGGKYPTDVETLKKALDLRGIQICNCWFSSFLISRPYEETEKEFIKQTDFLKAMGAKVIGVSEQSYSIQGKDQPIFEGKYVMNDEEWKLLTDGLNKLGQIAKDKGMMLTFHHHMGTVIQTEEEIDRFMNEVDKDLVYLLFDSGHCSFAGIDPVKVLSKYIDRTRHIHLKDLRSDVVAQSKKEGWSFLKGVREGTFTVPGDGDVEAYKAMEKYVEKGKIRSIGLSNWYIEELEDFLPQVDTIPALVQNEIHPYYQELEVVPYIQSKGIVVQGWYPFGGRGHTSELLNDETIVEIANAHNVTAAQVILRWNLQRGIVVIPGSSNPDHIKENTEIYHFELTDEEMQDIESLNRDEKHDCY